MLTTICGRSTTAGTDTGPTAIERFDGVVAGPLAALQGVEARRRRGRAARGERDEDTDRNEACGGAVSVQLEFLNSFNRRRETGRGVGGQPGVESGMSKSETNLFTRIHSTLDTSDPSALYPNLFHSSIWTTSVVLILVVLAFRVSPRSCPGAALRDVAPESRSVCAMIGGACDLLEGVAQFLLSLARYCRRGSRPCC